MPVDSETVPVGQPAPDFELTSIDGGQVRLSGLRGKPVVLVFLRGFM
jgi:peroxiredoxin